MHPTSSCVTVLHMLSISNDSADARSKNDTCDARSKEVSPPDLGDKILDAAASCVLAYGVERVTLAEIARRAGVSRPTIYRRWPDTRALLAALINSRVVGPRDLPARDGGREALVERIVGVAERLRHDEVVMSVFHSAPELAMVYIDAAWARWVRPWTLAAWMCLTLGIAMGSWWAYYELGWGGFWFWDPGRRLLHAVARRHRAAPFGSRDRGTARRAEGMDHPPRHHHLLFEPDGDLPRPLRCVDERACVCRRSRARHLHPRHHGPPSSAARSRCSLGARRSLSQGGLFAPISREGALVPQQSPAHHRMRRRVPSARSIRSRSMRSPVTRSRSARPSSISPLPRSSSRF